MSKVQTALVAYSTALMALNAAIAEEGGAAVGAAATPAATTEKATKTTKTTKSTKADAPVNSRTDLAAVLNEVKEAKGAAVAKGLIKNVGKSDKLVDVADANVDALYEAAKAELGEGEGEGEGDGL